MENLDVSASWQMWATCLIIAVAVYCYITERFSIEAISVSVIVTLLVFFHFFAPQTANLNSQNLLSGFAAPALITIMALLVVGQGMYHTGALEGPVLRLNSALDKSPRRTLGAVFLVAFAVSMFMNNTPVVVMFIPVLAAMAARLRQATSRYMMPLSFISILAGMTTLIGSSTNLLVNDVYLRYTGQGLDFFTQFQTGIILAFIGAAYIIIFAPILLPNRESLGSEFSNSGRQFIAQIKIVDNHPLNGAAPKAGLYPLLKNVTVRLIVRGDKTLLPPFETPLQPMDLLIVSTTRKSLSALLASDQRYLEGMLNIAGFASNKAQSDDRDTILISEAIIAPGSRMTGRSIEQIGFRQNTGCLVLGIQRRTRMIRASMMNIRLEEGDVLLLFGYENEMRDLRQNRDLLLLDWATQELPDIRRALTARSIFAATILLAATNILPIDIAALTGALLMIVSGCLNIRQAIRALDMRIFLLIGAAFAMGLALEETGAAAYMAMVTVETFSPFGVQALIAAMFLMVAIMTNLISNSATALLFSPIALSVAEQAQIDPIVMVLTVIFAANCSFATPIAYQTNLLVMGPGHYKFSDFARFGVPLMILIWVSFSLLSPFFFDL